MTDKKSLRAHCLALRAGISPSEMQAASEAISEKLYSLEEYKNADLILTFVSVGNEPYTRGIIRSALAAGKKVAVPFTENGVMSFRYLDDLSSLFPGEFDIPVSRGETVEDFGKCLCVTPALCVDSRFFRLGYGGGYYDRFIADNSGIFYATVCLDRFIFDSIPVTPQDRAVDCIISEKRLERRCI